MKQVPAMYNADQIKREDWPEREIKAAAPYARNAYWALARPMSMGGVFTRLRMAWLVFTGECDALKWTQQ